MKPFFALSVAFLFLAPSALLAQGPGQPLVSGLQNPQAAIGGPGGTYVSVAGELGKDGDGAIMIVSKGQAQVYASGLDDPKGMVMQSGGKFGKGGGGGGLLVADNKRIWQIAAKGKPQVFLAADAFPTPPVSLCGLTIDPESGSIYVSDAGDKDGKGGAVYKIAVGGKNKIVPGGKDKIAPGGKNQVTLVTNQAKWPELKRPTGLAMDGKNHLLVVDAGTGILYRIPLAGGAPEKVTDGLGEAIGLVWDHNGRLFISDQKGGKVFVIGRPGQTPVPMAQSFQSPGGIGVDPATRTVLIPDTKAGTVIAVAAQVPGAEVDDSPMPLEATVAFPKLKWTNWSSISDTGKQVQHRPIVLTHAGDGSNRVFVATQHGVIHAFPNGPNADKTSVFLDIQKKVTYLDNQNEEGFLGLAFHPKYKTNGEFFVFYTLKMGKNQHINVVSRFRVSKDDPNKADPNSEEELMRITHNNWNHDGGTICFGPDGYLYLTTGDGGGADDVPKNGQNLNTLLAKVLRIDVDHKDPGLNYAIPKDNPFVGRKDARPEIWAYGLRNIWRMAFDRKTGTLWAGDVGQNLFEEVDIIVKGGNYGWSIREGFHPFSAKGVGPRKDIIEPIWEFPHAMGMNCVIGGNVSRSSRLPELDGAYLYADYPTGKVWALRYDEAAKRVTANRPLRTPGQPILSFGEDEMGDVYFMTTSLTGQGIYHFRRTEGTK